MTTTGLRIEACPKRVRAYSRGVLVLDTTAARYVWEVPHYPAWYSPLGDLRVELVDTGGRAEDGAHLHDLVVDGRTLSAAARTYDGARAGWVRLDFDALDTWLEEDEPVYTHPRSPYTRVDVLPSSRLVQVEVGGVEVARSTSSRMLFETGLPRRCYLPLADVRMDLLEPTDTVSHCPYKGAAQYWTVVVDARRHEDVAWGYRTPLPESRLVAGLVCFYDEKVDVSVDGVRQGRPVTKFS